MNALETMYFRSFSGEDVTLATGDQVVVTRPFMYASEYPDRYRLTVGDLCNVRYDVYADDHPMAGYVVHKVDDPYQGYVVENRKRVVDHCELYDENDARHWALVHIPF
jgi:alpha-beta hydrolase superfamily lysophospholipase